MAVDKKFLSDIPNMERRLYLYNEDGTDYSTFCVKQEVLDDLFGNEGRLFGYFAWHKDYLQRILRERKEKHVAFRFPETNALLDNIDNVPWDFSSISIKNHFRPFLDMSTFPLTSKSSGGFELPRNIDKGLCEFFTQNFTYYDMCQLTVLFPRQIFNEESRLRVSIDAVNKFISHFRYGKKRIVETQSNFNILSVDSNNINEFIETAEEVLNTCEYELAFSTKLTGSQFYLLEEVKIIAQSFIKICKSLTNIRENRYDRNNVKLLTISYLTQKATVFNYRSN